MTDQQADKLTTLRNEQLVTLIDGLRAAKDQHNSWVWDIHRTLLCEIHVSANGKLDPATCAFGGWLRTVADEPLVRHTGNYQRMYRQHLKMHQAARHLVLSASKQRPVPVSVYDDFIAQRNRFKAVVERFERSLWDMACLIDQLTGLRNRYGMLSDLLNEQQRAVREDGNCSIAIVDIDHFKSINDNHGHKAGDLLLQQLAQLLASSLRPYDHIYRYGGEEFIICLPGTGMEEAKAILERMRQDISTLDFVVDGTVIPVTASFGLSPVGRGNIEDYIEHADEALYVAKAAGRNRVEAYQQPLAGARPVIYL